jgi:hypothetical protein
MLFIFSPARSSAAEFDIFDDCFERFKLDTTSGLSIPPGKPLIKNKEEEIAHIPRPTPADLNITHLDQRVQVYIPALALLEEIDIGRALEVRQRDVRKDTRERDISRFHQITQLDAAEGQCAKGYRKSAFQLGYPV